MPKKKTIKLNPKNLHVCENCGRPKLKDESKVSNDRMQMINEVMQRIDNVRLG